MSFLKYLLSKDYRMNYSAIFVERLNFEEQQITNLYDTLFSVSEYMAEEGKAS